MASYPPSYQQRLRTAPQTGRLVGKQPQYSMEQVTARAQSHHPTYYYQSQQGQYTQGQYATSAAMNGTAAQPKSYHQQYAAPQQYYSQQPISIAGAPGTTQTVSTSEEDLRKQWQEYYASLERQKQQQNYQASGAPGTELASRSNAVMNYVAAPRSYAQAVTGAPQRMAAVTTQVISKPPSRPSQTRAAPNAKKNDGQCGWPTGKQHSAPLQKIPSPRNVISYPTNDAPERIAVATKPTPKPQPEAAKLAETPDLNQWPPSLHKFVERCFGQCRTPEDKSVTQDKLRDFIANAILEGVLWKQDWPNMPLPEIPSKVQEPPPRSRTPPPTDQTRKRSRWIPEQPTDYIPLSAKRQGIVSSKKSKGPIDQPLLAKGAASSDLPATDEEFSRRQQRAQRFVNSKDHRSRKIPIEVSQPRTIFTQEGELDLEAMTIKGTCSKIEKDYLRLTSAPDPATVRPEPILRRALENVKTKWSSKKQDYWWICSQLKALRQDCTVQRIKNSFTVDVYETHALIALEEGDMNEFNQSQTQLKELYEQNHGGREMEFIAYRILYYVYIQGRKKNESGTLDMSAFLTALSPRVKVNKFVAHALQVRESVAFRDYHRFFLLYSDAPNMGRCIMKRMVDGIRLEALQIICKAYAPTVPLEFIYSELRVDNDQRAEFFKNSGLVLTSCDPTKVDTKESARSIAMSFSGSSSLI